MYGLMLQLKWKDIPDQMATKKTSRSLESCGQVLKNTGHVKYYWLRYFVLTSERTNNAIWVRQMVKSKSESSNMFACLKGDT